MKCPQIFVLSTLIAFGSAASAEEAWLLVFSNDEFRVVKAESSGLRTVATVGHQATYGESAVAIALLSQRGPDATSILDVFDKTTGQLALSWPVSGHPIAQVSGPSRDVFLTREFAYFVTIRYSPDRTHIEPNQYGGSFDLNELSLANGKQRAIALPKNLYNPRVISHDGVPIVYDWNGTGVWRFDEKNSGGFEQVLSRMDIEDTVIAADADSVAGNQRVGAFAEYVMLPDAGLFRLSRLDNLQQVLDADLRHTAKGGGPLDLEAGDNAVRVYPATYDGRHAIGVLRKTGAGFAFDYVDPMSAKSLWQFSMSKGVMPDSVLATKSAVYYIDASSALVMKTTRNRTTRIWNLKRELPNVNTYGARILSITEAR